MAAKYGGGVVPLQGDETAAREAIGGIERVRSGLGGGAGGRTESAGWEMGGRRARRQGIESFCRKGPENPRGVPLSSFCANPMMIQYAVWGFPVSRLSVIDD